MGLKACDMARVYAKSAQARGSPPPSTLLGRPGSRECGGGGRLTMASRQVPGPSRGDLSGGRKSPIRDCDCRSGPVFRVPHLYGVGVQKARLDALRGSCRRRRRVVGGFVLQRGEIKRGESYRRVRPVCDRARHGVRGAAVDSVVARRAGAPPQLGPIAGIAKLGGGAVRAEIGDPDIYVKPYTAAIAFVLIAGPNPRHPAPNRPWDEGAYRLNRARAGLPSPMP